ncbi:MAG: CsgG/HfaB family protein [Elusimicrobiota bacterium]
MNSNKFLLILYLISSVPIVFAQQVPEPPALSSPENEKTINITDPLLKWSAVDTADCYNAAIYSDKSCINKITISKPYPEEPFWKVPAGILEKGKTYYWRVAAHNFDGWSKPSAVWSFSVYTKRSSEVTSQLPKSELENIAVADFAGKNVSQADASIVADFLRTELVRIGFYTVIEKANMDKILAEAAFQQTGCTTSECAVQIGKLLNVKKMVVGNLSKLMDTFYITVNLVDVESGKILSSFDQEATTSKELRTSAQDLARQLTGAKPAVRKVEPSTRPAPQKIEPTPTRQYGVPLRYLTGKVVAIDGKKVTIDLGYLNGVRWYHQFNFILGEEKVNPYTGETMITKPTKIGWMRIEQIDDWTSTGEIISLKKGEEIQIGDSVKLRIERGLLSYEWCANTEDYEDSKFEWDWKFPICLRIKMGYIDPYFMYYMNPFFYSRLSLDWRWFEWGLGPIFTTKGQAGLTSTMRIGPYDGPFNIIGRSYITFESNPGQIFLDEDLNIIPSKNVTIYAKLLYHIGYSDYYSYYYSSYYYDGWRSYYIDTYRIGGYGGLKISFNAPVSLFFHYGGFEYYYYSRFSSDSYDTSYVGFGIEFPTKRRTYGIQIENESGPADNLLGFRAKLKYNF